MWECSTWEPTAGSGVVAAQKIIGYGATPAGAFEAWAARRAIGCGVLRPRLRSVPK